MKKSDSSILINKALVAFEEWKRTNKQADLETYISQNAVDSKVAAGLRKTAALEEKLRLLAKRDTVDFRESRLAGAVIGNYRFIRNLGVGGMGTVWLAEQLEPVRREVAIKLIRHGRDTANFLKRFEAEQQALAKMSHPHIAKVLDAGRLGDDRPYFVMDFVPGMPINEYCNQHRLDLKQRLKLFLQLCDAIQHAHQKGLLHRDIKPTNILITEVGGKPHVKVIDFGLVKDFMHEEAHLTQMAVPVGSPLWMSPEQALGRREDLEDIDTRTDIYSLGVILYQLLTDSTPISQSFFDQASPLELLEAIEGTMAPYPSVRLSKSANSSDWLSQSTTSNLSTWTKRLRNDLDWITMKAIEKVRERRYASVSALSDDIKRFLHDEPVEARPPSLGYRFQKLTRKHRVATVAVISIAALLLISTTVSTALTVWAMNAETAARIEQNRSKQMVDILFGCLQEFKESESSNSRETTKLLRAFTSMLDKEDFSDDPLIEARLRLSIARCLAHFGNHRQAIRQSERALLINDGMKEPGNDAIHVSAKTLLATELINNGQTWRALKVGRDCVETSRRQLGKVHDMTIDARVVVCRALFELGKLDESIAELIDLNEMVKKETIKGKLHPSLVQIKSLMSRVYFDRASTKQPGNFTEVAHTTHSKFENATAQAYDALKLSKRVHGANEKQTLDLELLHWEMQAFQFGLNKQPEKLLLHLNAKAEELKDNEKFFVSLRDLCGRILFDEGEFDLAMSVWQDNLEYFQIVHGQHHKYTAKCKTKMAFAHALKGEHVTASKMMKSIIHSTNIFAGKHSTQALYCQHDLGRLYYLRGSFDKSFEIAKAVLQNPSLSEDSPVRSDVLKLMGQCRLETGDIESASEYFTKAVIHDRDNFGAASKRSRRSVALLNKVKLRKSQNSIFNFLEQNPFQIRKKSRTLEPR